MLETKEQKQIFFASLVLIVLLVAVSYWRKDVKAPPQEAQTSDQSAADYNAYLASIQADPKASQQLLEQVVSPDDVKTQVEQALLVDQKITPPVLDLAKIDQSKDTGKAAVQSYLAGLGQVAGAFNSQALAESGNLFKDNEDLNAIQAAIGENSSALDSLYQLPVPAEALPLQKDALTVYASYLEILKLAQNYAQDQSADPWPQVYNYYAVVNSQMAALQGEVDKLSAKYQLSQAAVYPAEAEKPAKGALGIPAAQAQISGIPTTIVANIPQIIAQSIADGLASAFANFATQFLNNLINSIEKNYKISNFLYYTDALVSGQYVDDYLNKYVADPVDRSMIKNFIPQISCGQAPDLKPELKAKADQYLGFDPENLSPSDPDFYSQMSKVGDFLSSPTGWELYYEDLADAAESQAEQAANQELLSPGLKVPRDAQSTEIASTMEGIEGAMQAIFNGEIQLGVGNVTNLVSQIVSNVTYNLFNKFVFKGAYVYNEQSTCVDVPQISPIIPNAAAAGSGSSGPIR